MGYANPVERMGLKIFAEAATAAGVDGVLIVDYPPEESQTLADTMDASGIDLIYLLSPTSSTQRIKLVSDAARGYIYYVSLKGVTGAASIDTSEVELMIAKIKSQTTLPVGVGFGIRDGETARRISQFADAVVIGSRLIQELEASSPEVGIERVHTLLADIRITMDS